ncbi:hypothetical protein L1887_02562 [Cichorium endivia]|nr:hypothetical protein L1887_02562 [Cichorium endivia]
MSLPLLLQITERPNQGAEDIARFDGHSLRLGKCSKDIPRSIHSSITGVNYSNRKCFKLSITDFETNNESMKPNIPKATSLCLSFGATSQVTLS